ncbi:mitochondrial large ribosomal subunit protein [Malassezia pachydermatis]|uniref:Large ribosomal subunit protein bL28m n=1 Tax=Malassezia pachydermatis TaxID=77020 RepID=A0A0M8MRK5_9BASI|nr:mrpl24-mitochondrial ribosomal large subunit [Malassezia pachydermatis]KOS12914.1 mrpl24-mitochondrial ribosomal large subunit [Malassezia pachydermatis]
MFASLVRWSRTTYRGARGSGAGRSGKTDSRSSSASRPTDVAAAHAGRTFKRAQRGLYDGRILQFGNTIPNSRHKTARRWEPNVQRKTLWSETLQQWVSTRVATSAMRSIRKHGGLDQYLAQTKDTHLGEFGRTLRERVARALRDKRLMNEA